MDNVTNAGRRIKQTKRTAETVAEKLAKMTEAKREAWMRRNGYTGLAAFALSKKVRAVLSASLTGGKP